MISGILGTLSIEPKLKNFVDFLDFGPYAKSKFPDCPWTLGDLPLELGK